MENTLSANILFAFYYFFHMSDAALKAHHTRHGAKLRRLRFRRYCTCLCRNFNSVLIDCSVLPGGLFDVTDASEAESAARRNARLTKPGSKPVPVRQQKDGTDQEESGELRSRFSLGVLLSIIGGCLIIGVALLREADTFTCLWESA